MDYLAFFCFFSFLIILASSEDSSYINSSIQSLKKNITTIDLISKKQKKYYDVIFILSTSTIRLILADILYAIKEAK